MKPWLMISMPMNGLDENEIHDKWVEYRNRFIDEYSVAYTIFDDTDFNMFSVETTALTHYSGAGVSSIPLAYLAMSLAVMSTCDAVFFAPGWKEARGCRIEHDVAEAYGLKLIYD